MRDGGEGLFVFATGDITSADNGGTIIVDDVPPGLSMGGDPARPVEEWRREVVARLRLPELVKRVRALERRAEGAGRPQA